MEYQNPLKMRILGCYELTVKVFHCDSAKELALQFEQKCLLIPCFVDVGVHGLGRKKVSCTGQSMEIPCAPLKGSGRIQPPDRVVLSSLVFGDVGCDAKSACIFSV